MKVLVVDDSPIVRERLKPLLSEVPKAELVGQAKDQREAIELLHKLNPEVMVLDIQMPGGSGIELLAKVEKEQNPPLIVLTNLSNPQYRKKCMDAGGALFFDKSGEFDKVTEVLNKLS